MSEKCKHGIRDTETNLPYCRRCDEEAKGELAAPAGYAALDKLVTENASSCSALLDAIAVSANEHSNFLAERVCKAEQGDKDHLRLRRDIASDIAAIFAAARDEVASNVKSSNPASTT